MKRTLIIAAALAGFAALLAFASSRGFCPANLLGSTATPSAAAPSAAAPSPAAAPAAAVPALTEDPSSQTAPDFELQDLNGRTVRLSDFRGKAVVLNFWATWCPPCRHEIPWFIDLQKQYGPQGLEVIGISADQAGAAVVADFVKSNGINYTVAMANHQVMSSYGGVSVLPTTFYIGRDGKVLESVSGLISRDEIERNIRTALATAPL